MYDGNQDRLTQDIKSMALELGFSDVGITDACLSDVTQERFFEALEMGRHGDMAWLETRKVQRASPQALWPEAKSVIMLGTNYGVQQGATPLDILQNSDLGYNSLYASRKDYHDRIKKRLKALGRWLVEATGCEIKVFVDTAPVLEKPLAQQAGLGWQGKHTNLVSRGYGSWLLLGVIYTTLELTRDTPEADHCGRCNKCLDVCPTDAFPAPYQLDAKRCLAYLSIEYKGHIPIAFRKPMGNRIFGCDDCLLVCPWNKFARDCHDTDLNIRDDIRCKPLIEWLMLDDAAFRQIFAGTPVKRTGRDCFMRNVLIACGNAPYDTDLLEGVKSHLTDASAVIRGAAVWALSQHLNAEEFHDLREHYYNQEADVDVQNEWQHVS